MTVHACVAAAQRSAADSHDVVEVHTMLRIIFSRLGPSTAFSVNCLYGMCPECEGTGRVSTIDVTQLADIELSLNESAITVPISLPIPGTGKVWPIPAWSIRTPS